MRNDNKALQLAPRDSLSVDEIWTLNSPNYGRIEQMGNDISVFLLAVRVYKNEALVERLSECPEIHPKEEGWDGFY